MQILLRIWIAVWQYPIIHFVFQEAKFSPSIKAVVGTCSCAVLLTIWVSDCYVWLTYEESGQIYCQISLLRLAVFMLTIWNMLLYYFSWLFGFQIVRFSSHRHNQEQFTVSFISRLKFSFLFFEEDVRIWSLCEFLDHLDCSHGVKAVF